MNINLSADETKNILSQLVGMRLSSIRLNDEGRLIFGFGEIYHSSNLYIDANSFRVVSADISEYELLINAEIQLMNVALLRKTVYDTVDYSNLSIFKSTIVNNILEKIDLIWGEAVELYFGGYFVRILYNSDNTESWRLLQPGTEADQLLGYKTQHQKCIRLQKRWSPNHINERERWHSIYTEAAAAQAGRSSLKMLFELEGTVISYGLKSLDMNLYDIGFEHINSKSEHNSPREYSLHISCGFSISTAKSSFTFWGDTDKSIFENYVSSLVGQHVENVSIGAGNVLCLNLRDYLIRIVPADDGAESWRLFMPQNNTPHLVAANSWIRSN